MITSLVGIMPSSNGDIRRVELTPWFDNPPGDWQHAAHSVLAHLRSGRATPVHVRSFYIADGTIRVRLHDMSSWAFSYKEF